MSLDDDKTRLPEEDSAHSAGILRSGEVFGSYRVIRLLGRGGMGEVYEVEHVDLVKRYALKIVSPELMNSPGALERFKREARVMAGLEHRHILKVDDFGETGGKHWLRLELATGVAALRPPERKRRAWRSCCKRADVWRRTRRGSYWSKFCRVWPTRMNRGWCIGTSSRPTFC